MTMQRSSPRSLRTWSPFEDPESYLQSWDWPFRWMWTRRPSEEIGWTPRMDVYEKPDAYTVMAELPGVKMEDIEVSMSDNSLTIKGERKSLSDVKDDEYQRSEMCYGEFQRSLRFADAVAPDKVEAMMENGVLMVRVPKSEGAKQHKIEVKSV